MDRKKLIKLIEKFLETLEIKNICQFWVDNEEEEEDLEGIWVYIVIDRDYLEKNLPYREGIARRMVGDLKNKLMNVFGFNDTEIHIGVLSKPCGEETDNQINEEKDTQIKRRVGLLIDQLQDNIRRNLNNPKYIKRGDTPNDYFKKIRNVSIQHLLNGLPIERDLEMSIINYLENYIEENFRRDIKRRFDRWNK